jgi:two-component system response regulator MprA
VAEDDSEIRQAVIDMLEFSGYEVRTAPNGAQALDTLDRWRPDAIILDMLMPEMDGPTFLKSLRARGKDDIPVILLSAMRDLAERAATLPIADVIAKPFDVDELLVALERLWAADQANFGRGQESATQP